MQKFDKMAHPAHYMAHTPFLLMVSTLQGQQNSSTFQGLFQTQVAIFPDPSSHFYAKWQTKSKSTGQLCFD